MGGVNNQHSLHLQYQCDQFGIFVAKSFENIATPFMLKLHQIEVSTVNK